MESVSKKSISCESNDGIEDRLSGLPDELIVHILSLMPTLDAVRTMLLRPFRNLWTLVPALSFEYYGYYCRIADKPPSTHVSYSSFTCFVRNALLLNRRSTIDSFRLCICNLDKKSTDTKIIGDVQMLLRYAIEREVKDLYFHYNAHFFDPPGCVFTSQYLVTLTLFCCTLEHYEHQSQPQMVNLRKLSLLFVGGSNKAFNQLISGCPCLQELFINTAFGLELVSLNINSPSVRKLYLRVSDGSYNLNCPSLKILDIAICETDVKLNMIGVISLQEVNFEDLPWDCDSGEINAYFSLSQNAELISFSSVAFKGISFIKKMEFPQNRWKRIVLHPQWNHERCLEVICMLIKSSINLEELIIYAGESSGNCELFSPGLSTCVLPLLRTVTIHGNHGYEKWCEGQLQVIEFLLKNAVILEKLVITFGENKLTAVEKFDLVKQVSTFRRASVNATVIFT
ncbi:F-box/FBD/LRR-repeat protein At5g56420-like [Silene latifolia]|uniref:F-box/FBD/LRR-repeat protein At5g56420-like n=1 Tax=Silene latifolia TaxID=37657 RepID=UPI003D77A734